MSEITPTKQRSPAAERMRISRQRRRDGMRIVPFEVRDAEIENLIKLSLLNQEHRNDRAAVARALGTLLDKIPVAWWQEAIQLRRGQ